MAFKNIIASGLEGRYAKALFQLALEKKAVNAVAKDMDNIAAMIFKSSDFSEFLKNPTLGSSVLKKTISVLSQKGKFHKLTEKFLSVLIENRRLSYLGKIIRSFKHILAEFNEEVTAEIISAEKLTKTQEGALQKKLKASLGRDITFDIAVDETLLGGLKVRVGSRVIDASLKTKLENLTLQMKGV